MEYATGVFRVLECAYHCSTQELTLAQNALPVSQRGRVACSPASERCLSTRYVSSASTTHHHGVMQATHFPVDAPLDLPSLSIISACDNNQVSTRLMDSHHEMCSAT